jgi:hypothetical protein
VQASNPATQNPFRSALIERCTFRDNTAGNAAGLAVGNFRGGALVQDCIFDNNVAQNSAGALFFAGVGSYVVRRNLFVDSVADGSGSARLAGAIWAGNEFVIEENTFVGSHHGSDIYGGAAILVEGTSSQPSVIRRNVIVDCTGGAAIGMFSGTIVTECNVFWNNAEGEGIALDPTDLVADPQFCNPKSGDYTVSSTSPCLPENNPSCDETIGALGVGCGLVSIAPMSWGRIKGLYQPNEE